MPSLDPLPFWIIGFVFYAIFGLVVTPFFWLLYKEEVIGFKVSPWRALNLRFEKHTPKTFRIYVVLLWPLIYIATILATVFVDIPIAAVAYIKYGEDGKPAPPSQEETTAPVVAPSITAEYVEPSRFVKVAMFIAMIFGLGLAMQKLRLKR